MIDQFMHQKHQHVKFVTKYVKNTQEAEDIFQECIILMLEHGHKAHNPDAYFKRVLRNASINRLQRKPKLEKNAVEFDDKIYMANNTAEDLLTTKQTYIACKKLVNKLRELIKKHSNNRPGGKLLALESMLEHPDVSAEIIAAKYGINRNTFRSNIKHIRSLLKKENITLKGVL